MGFLVGFSTVVCVCVCYGGNREWNSLVGVRPAAFSQWGK